MFRNLSRKIDLFLYRHGMTVIMSTIIVIFLVTLAILRMAVQTMDLNARLIGEMKQMQVQINTHEARINGLADEQAWVRESVKISAELK